MSYQRIKKFMIHCATLHIKSQTKEEKGTIQRTFFYSY